MGDGRGGRSELGALLRAHRRRLLWTQARLADAAGVSERTVSDIERGIHTGTRLETLRRLADAMSLTEVEAEQMLGAGQERRDAERAPGGRGSLVSDDAMAAAEVGAWNLAVERIAEEAHQMTAVTTDPATYCDTLLALGRSATLAMRRHDARPAFVQAARLAMSLHDRDRLTAAAAGYAFLTKAGDPVAGADETWRRANLELSDGDAGGRALVTAARATALVLGGSIEPAIELSTHALGLARASGSPDALAVAISTYVLATRGLPNVTERLDLAGELADVEGSALDHVELAGVELRACPLLEMGDLDGFESCAAEMRETARVAHHPFALAQAEAWTATVALLRGDFLAAEESSARAVSLSGHAPNFSEGHLAQVFSIRRAQGRDVELLDSIERSLTFNTQEMAWRAAWASTAATLPARRADVRTGLDRVRIELWPLARTWTYPVTLAFLAEAAWMVGDEQIAVRLADALRPHSGRYLVVTTATSCEGAVDHYLGLAMSAAGDPVAGRALLQAGRRQHEVLRAPALVARSDDALAAT